MGNKDQPPTTTNPFSRGEGIFEAFGFCLLALVLQFAELTHRAEIGDISAILDTVRAITLAAATLSAGTISLNALAARRGA